MDHPASCACGKCGATTALLDFGYQAPDCIWSLPPAKRSPRNTSDFAELGARRFVRGILPIKIQGSADEFRYGLWFEVEPAKFDEIRAVWNDPSYAQLTFAATVANAAPPWRDEMLGAKVACAVRDVNSRPFVAGAHAPWLAALVENGWSQDAYRRAVASFAPGAPRDNL